MGVRLYSKIWRQVRVPQLKSFSKRSRDSDGGVKFVAEFLRSSKSTVYQVIPTLEAHDKHVSARQRFNLLEGGLNFRYKHGQPEEV